ncbi:MAG: hypothetical protein ABFS56_08095 [Pseudomonadota bacterium]
MINGGYHELQGKSPRARQIWFQSYIHDRLFRDFDSVYNAKGDYRRKLKLLIPYLAGLSGQLLKYASIANDLALNEKVVKSYFEALEWMFSVMVVASPRIALNLMFKGNHKGLPLQEP